MTEGAGDDRRGLWLARHGQTDDNLAGDVFQGFRDTPLNDTGRAQACTLAERLLSDRALAFASLTCSDLSRARETASIVGAALGLTPVTDARLREGNRGDWEGRRFSDVQASEPERYAAWLRAGPEFRFPGGETLLEQQTRVLAALSDVRAGSPLPALVVCHRGSIRVALCRADPRGLYAFHAHDIDNAGVVAFLRWPERLPARLPLILFGVLALASVGAFYLTQHLKVQNPLYNGAPRADPATINPRDAGVCLDENNHLVSFRSTKVGFYLQSKSDTVIVEVVDPEGTIVADMHGSGRYIKVGPQYSFFTWNGRESDGQYAPAGLYTFRLVLVHQGRDFPLSGVSVRVQYARPTPRVTGISVDQGTGTTATPVSTPPGRTPAFDPDLQSVSIHYRAASSDIGANVLVYRANPDGTIRLVKTYGIGGHSRVATWNGTINGRPAPAGSYLIGLRVKDAACTTGQYPEVTDPVPGSTDGAGVNVSYLEATPPLDPVAAGQSASVAVQAGGASYSWQLRLAGQSKVISHGISSANRLSVRLPDIGLYELSLRAGSSANRVVRTAVPLVASGVGARAHARVLVVLPALSWQGANAVDGSSDGLIDTLNNSGDQVSLDRPLIAGLPTDFADEAGLLNFLNSEHFSYDLTTDVALAEGTGPDLVGRSGIILDGTFTWIPTQIVNPLTGFVRAGGGVFAAGLRSLQKQASLTGIASADPMAGPARALSRDPFGVTHGAVSPTDGEIITEFVDHLGILTNVAAFQATRYQVLDPSGSQIASVAGVSPAAPTVIGFHLGHGTVVEAGLPDFGSELGRDVDARQLLARVWQVVLTR